MAGNCAKLRSHWTIVFRMLRLMAAPSLLLSVPLLFSVFTSGQKSSKSGIFEGLTDIGKTLQGSTVYDPSTNEYRDWRRRRYVGSVGRLPFQLGTRSFRMSQLNRARTSKAQPQEPDSSFPCYNIHSRRVSKREFCSAGALVGA